MTMIDDEKLAAALECVADYVDATEGRRAREKKAALEQRLAAFEGRYEELTGSAMPAAFRDKLASLDEDGIDQLFQLVTKTAGGSPESLGGPDQSDTNKTASDAASDHHKRFLDWLSR